jgi:hypothetical protein
LEALIPEAEWNNVKLQLLKTKRVDTKVLQLVDPVEFEVKK